MTSEAGGPHEQILSAGDVAKRIAEHGVKTADGTRRTILWEHDGSTAGVLELPAGAVLGEHEHIGHLHHVWVIHGHARVQGQPLGAGAYWFVPPGRPHTLEAISPDGCQLFYVYLRATP